MQLDVATTYQPAPSDGGGNESQSNHLVPLAMLLIQATAARQSTPNTHHAGHRRSTPCLVDKRVTGHLHQGMVSLRTAGAAALHVAVVAPALRAAAAQSAR